MNKIVRLTQTELNYLRDRVGPIHGRDRVAADVDQKLRRADMLGDSGPLPVTGKGLHRAAPVSAAWL